MVIIITIISIYHKYYFIITVISNILKFRHAYNSTKATSHGQTNMKANAWQEWKNIWAMIGYMWPSFLKHLIDITSFILISVHNFHQTYIYRIFIHMISTGKENHFYLEFQCMALGSFPNWFVSSNWAICWKVWLKISEKNWIKVDANAVLRLTEDPKTIVWKASPQKHSKHAHLHQLIFIYSWIYVERNIVLRKRINAYRALASPSLIALSSKVVEIFQSNVAGDVDIYIGGGVFKSSLFGLSGKVIEPISLLTNVDFDIGIVQVRSFCQCWR